MHPSVNDPCIYWNAHSHMYYINILVFFFYPKRSRMQPLKSMSAEFSISNGIIIKHRQRNEFYLTFPNHNILQCSSNQLLYQHRSVRKYYLTCFVDINAGASKKCQWDLHEVKLTRLKTLISQTLKYCHLLILLILSTLRFIFFFV